MRKKQKKAAVVCESAIQMQTELRTVSLSNSAPPLLISHVIVFGAPGLFFFFFPVQACFSVRVTGQPRTTQPVLSGALIILALFVFFSSVVTLAAETERIHRLEREEG